MEWQKPQIISYSEEELVKELQVKAFSGQDNNSNNYNNSGYGSYDQRG
jgi:hypothetical protein